MRQKLKMQALLHLLMHMMTHKTMKMLKKMRVVLVMTLIMTVLPPPRFLHLMGTSITHNTTNTKTMGACLNLQLLQESCTYV